MIEKRPVVEREVWRQVFSVCHLAGNPGIRSS